MLIKNLKLSVDLDNFYSKKETTETLTYKIEDLSSSLSNYISNDDINIVYNGKHEKLVQNQAIEEYILSTHVKIVEDGEKTGTTKLDYIF